MVCWYIPLLLFCCSTLLLFVLHLFLVLHACVVRSALVSRACVNNPFYSSLSFCLSLFYEKNVNVGSFGATKKGGGNWGVRKGGSELPTSCTFYSWFPPPSNSMRFLPLCAFPILQNSFLSAPTPFGVPSPILYVVNQNPPVAVYGHDLLTLSNSSSFFP